MTRRQFAAGLAAAPAALAAAPAPRVGVDLFSLRSQGWDALTLLEYSARQGARVVHYSEIRFLGSLEDEHVRKVGQRARELGVELEIGMRSICPSSKAFDPKQGTAEEQITRVMRAAQLAGSKLVRAFLGTSADRVGPVPMEAHIENAVKTLRNVRSRAQDMGLRIAIENHSGDMQARELKTLVEAAGKDVVGVCYDSGNPCWAIEDPSLTLEVLAPYVLTAHIRDSYLWPVAEGTAVRWVRMGEGNIGMERLLRRFVELCPGKSMSLEVIVTGPRIFAWRKPEFWDAYRHTPAWEFARFLDLAQAGQPQVWQAPPREQAAQREREDFEASMQWMRQHVG